MFVTQTYKSLEVPPVFLQRLKPGSAGGEERENPTVSFLLCRLLVLLLSRFSRVRLCATLWTAAHQAPPSTGFSRQEYWSGLPFLPLVCRLNWVKLLLFCWSQSFKYRRICSLGLLYQSITDWLKKQFWRWEAQARGVSRVGCYWGLNVCAQPCPTLCDPMGCSPLGFSVHGISQARILECIAISLSKRSSWPRDWSHVSWIDMWILYHWATREATEG